MNDIYVKDLIRLCNAKLVFGNPQEVLQDFSKDTRTIQKGEVYLGIKGANFDGNDYYLEALEKGALGCILNDNISIPKNLQEKYSDRFIVLVNDTIDALIKLAIYKRSLYSDLLVVGITGSVGKTSTKDIVAGLLSSKYNVLKTAGNYNNHLGVPLTILKLRNHDALVIEMGMSNLNEISKLSKIAKPTIGIITNIGTSHIANLQSRENILKAKLEILDGMKKDGLLIINNDNDLLHSWYQENQNNLLVKTFGIQNTSDYMANNIVCEDNFSTYTVKFSEEACSFKINIPGRHFILNSLAAIAVSDYLGIKYSKMQEKMQNISLTGRRMEIQKINNITIINDSYNANYDSVKEAINYLGKLNNRKIAVLGSMLELGSFSKELHRKIGDEIVKNNLDEVIIVGAEAKEIYEECLLKGFPREHIHFYNTVEEACSKLKEIIVPHDTILLKASNGMHFEKIFNYLNELETFLI